MKKHILYIVLLFSLTQLYSQEDGVVALSLPVRNSLKFNKYAINPTFSFVREQNKYISFSNNRQWVQFDDAPQTYLFSYAGRFRENMGIGVGVFQQNYGVLTTFGGILNAAYNAALNRDSNLTFGINLGFYKSGINDGKVITNVPDPSLNNIPSHTLITINPGLNYGTTFLDLGVSINNLAAYNLTTSTMIEDNPEQSIQAHVMYTGYLDARGFFDESKFSSLIRSEFKKDQTVISGIMMLTVPKGLWGQVGYNSVYGISAGIGLNISTQIAIEYNYEKAIGDLSDFGNSHDITLAYKFKNRYRYDYSGDDDEAALIIPKKRSRSIANKRKSTNLPKVDRIAIAEEKAKAKIVAAEKAKAKADARAKLVAEAKARREAKIESVAQTKETQETEDQLAEASRVKAEQEAQAKLAEAARVKAEQEAQAKLAEAARVKAEQEAQAKLAEAARVKAEQEAQAKLAEAASLKSEREDTQQRIDTLQLDGVLVSVAKDREALAMESLTKLTEHSKIEQQDLLILLREKVASKQQDLKDLKEENDLSEQGIYSAPKAFKSVTAENAALEALQLEIDNLIESQDVKISELESLYKDRLKKFKDKDDETNAFYKQKIQELKSQQLQTVNTKAELLSTLDVIKADTEIERNRRIKRAAYDNEQDRYVKDRAALDRIKTVTDVSPTPLKTEDFDHGEELSNIQIVKDIKNVDSGYYLVIAVHSDVAKRDEFLTKAVSAGQTNIDFFYDVNTSKYYIYYDKFEGIDEAKSAMDAKGSQPYNSKMSMVKIEN